MHADAVAEHYLINMSFYVQRKVSNFVHSWVLLKEYIMFFLVGSDLCCQAKEVLEMIFLFFSQVSTPICHRFENSPRARMRWAWGRIQRWSTWWRWSSCRRADPSGREALRQTKYRKGQNTDEEGIEMCPKLLLFLEEKVDIDRKAIEFDKLTCGPISTPGLPDSWCKRQICFFSKTIF